MAPRTWGHIAPLLLWRGLGQGNPICWKQGFSFESCCSPVANPACFDLIYTQEVCCGEPGQHEESAGALQRLLRDCRAGLDLSGLPRPLQCRGSITLSAEDWDGLFHAHQLSQVLGTSFQGWPNVTRLLERANASRAALRAAEEDCAFGLVTLVLQMVPTIERQQDSRSAQRALAYAERLQARSAGLEDCRWQEMTNHAMFGHYRLLLGGDARFSGSCPQGLPRLFVYEGLSTAQKPFSCARTGFWSSEVYVERFLYHSACRERDAGRADFFFVPAYLTCWELQKVKAFSEEKKLAAAEELASEIRALPHWQRRHGFDHVFLFGASSWVLPGWRQTLANSVVLAVESRPIECESKDARCWHCADCFSPWKDLVLPPVTPLPMLRRLLATSRPVAERSLIMSWHGQHANGSSAAVQHAYRVTNETVRLSLLALAHLPKVSIGGPTPGYAEVMGSSHFCLCPKGASSYTSRVFEALFAGCVPVILSDDVRLPFEALVDWASFSIRWPMAEAGPELYDYLESLLSERPEHVLSLQQEVARVRCWFDYFATEADPMLCSPYLALMRGLASRLAVMPKAPPPFAGEH